MGLEKTHTNDAVAISGISVIKKYVQTVFQIKQFRIKKRPLHEAIARKARKAIKNLIGISHYNN
ncbi:hypothetical protein [Lentibacillus sp. Marseille-P4043]|uniref:hypothetical protein n=1 Tax=Lentibacillus sp. Marseille-P4043 TaxID=2040293 RepID=UPI000D0B8B02|nr:hypothetical protein [Lentibacillus sp. Marseille-P4043]